MAPAFWRRWPPRSPFALPSWRGALVPRDVANTLAPAKLPSGLDPADWAALVGIVQAVKERFGEVLRSRRRRMLAGIWAARWMRSKKRRTGTA